MWKKCRVFINNNKIFINIYIIRWSWKQSDNYSTHVENPHTSGSGLYFVKHAVGYINRIHRNKNFLWGVRCAWKQYACAVWLGQGRQWRDAILRLQFPANIAASRSGEEARRRRRKNSRWSCCFHSSFGYWKGCSHAAQRRKKRGEKRVIRFFCIRYV